MLLYPKPYPALAKRHLLPREIARPGNHLLALKLPLDRCIVKGNAHLRFGWALCVCWLELCLPVAATVKSAATVESATHMATDEARSCTPCEPAPAPNVARPGNIVTTIRSMHK